MIPAWRWAAMRATLMFQWEVMDKVTRQCPQTTTFLKGKESQSGIEPRFFCLPAWRLTARPNWLTKEREKISSFTYKAKMKVRTANRYRYKDRKKSQTGRLRIFLLRHNSVHKPQPFWKERRAETVSNRGPSAYQPTALPLGQTSSHMKERNNLYL